MSRFENISFPPEPEYSVSANFTEAALDFRRFITHFRSTPALGISLLQIPQDINEVLAADLEYSTKRYGLRLKYRFEGEDMETITKAVPTIAQSHFREGAEVTELDAGINNGLHDLEVARCLINLALDRSLEFDDLVSLIGFIDSVTIRIRALGDFVPPRTMSDSGNRAADIMEYIELRGLDTVVPNLLLASQNIVTLACTPIASDCLKKPQNNDSNSFRGHNINMRLRELKTFIEKAKQALESLKAVDIALLGAEVEVFIERLKMVKRPRSTKTIEAVKDKINTLVDRVLALPKDEFDAFSKENKEVMLKNDFYGTFIAKTLGLRSRNRISGGMELLLQNGIVTEDEKDACLALKGVSRSTKFREDYLFVLIGLAFETHQSKRQIASIIGAVETELVGQI